MTLIKSGHPALMDGKTIVVVSSDFTHFGEGYGYVPFKKDIEKYSTLDYGRLTNYF